MSELTPREIVAELDKYIIGQNQAKRMVAIAVRNRWRRQTNVARDLAQFSARFGRPLTYKLSKLAHYMQSPEKNFSGPLYLCFGFRIRLHLQPQAFAP